MSADLDKAQHGLPTQAEIQELRTLYTGARIELLSMADDPAAVPPQAFLGVIIMRARGLAHAITRAVRLGINPGGEVACITIDFPHVPEILPEHFDRLLSKADLEAAGYL